MASNATVVGYVDGIGAFVRLRVEDVFKLEGLSNDESVVPVPSWPPVYPRVAHQR